MNSKKHSILQPGEEHKQEELNRDLLTACTTKEPDFAQIERLLQQGAQPLGLTEYLSNKDYVYHAIINEYDSYEEDDEIYPFYRITELFLQYGMDLSNPVVPYDDWDYLHPMWSFTFFHTNAILKVLKLLLDRGMDAHAASKCWGHDLLDLSLFGVEKDEAIHKYFEHELARLMLFASYPHILDNDPDLQKEIQLSENDYDPVNFRNWERFYYRVDGSKRPDLSRLSGSAITIFEKGTGKEVWKFLFE